MALIVYQLYSCKELLDLVGPDGVGPDTQIQALKDLLDEEVEVGFHASAAHPSPA